MAKNNPPQRSGFNVMDPELHKEISARGLAKAKANGKQHRWTREEAAEAGRRSGESKRRKAEGEP